MTLFETQSLCKHYHPGRPFEVRALHDVNLRIQQGSWTVMTGPSGSGKTTLLAILAALDRPTSGTVLFAGTNLVACSDAELTRYRRRTGFIFQDYALIPDLTAEENIVYPLIARNWPRARRRDRARQLLGQFGLPLRSTSRVRELSGGEQQRVGIARALAGDPEIVFADEPTSNLDMETSQMITAVFQNLRASGKTVIISSHDQQIISSATDVLQLENGAIKLIQDESCRTATLQFSLDSSSRSRLEENR
jgi:putative ABC transport system ATP-binding protein